MEIHYLVTDIKFTRLLLIWYYSHARCLPWRGRRDPYALWVSEIMLQQTRVETVIPYFERWMKRFPSIETLANATEKEVLNLWEGLGYYSRARNLHQAAKMVAKEHAGALPRDLVLLRKLPGIGRYTAGAIASIAFGLDEPTLDGNIRRVLARLFDVSQPTDSAEGGKILWNLAIEHLPKGSAGDYNQALMDLGATICLPKNPRCSICPLMNLCLGCKNGVQKYRPVLKQRKKIPHYIHASAVVVKNGRALLAKRPSQGLLGGMWEFPNGRVKADPARSLVKVLQTEYQLKVKKKDALGYVDHAYTHFRVSVHAFRCEFLSKSSSRKLKWVRLGELVNYPMGKVDRQIALKFALDKDR
jgi:A/G-specific adenine glycosylase